MACNLNANLAMLNTRPKTGNASPNETRQNVSSMVNTCAHNLEPVMQNIEKKDSIT